MHINDTQDKEKKGRTPTKNKIACKLHNDTKDTRRKRKRLKKRLCN
jgi:hypothetical protein